MSTIKFYLGKEGKKGEALIFMVYQKSGKKFKVSTKENVMPKYWNSKTQKVRSSSNSSAINEELEKMKAKLEKVVRELRRDNEDFDVKDVKNRYLGEEQNNKGVGLFEYFEKFLVKKDASNKRKTLKEYETVINDLKEYEEHYKEKLTFEKLDDDFLSKYLKMLYEKKGNVTNTASKKVSTLKTMLRDASKAKVNSKSNVRVNMNMDFMDFKVDKVKTRKIFLTKEELLHLYKFDLTSSPRLGRVRDKFCFACFTGMRYGDLNQLKEEWIVERKNDGKSFNALQYKDEKTKTDIFIPLHSLAIEILEKYRKLKSEANEGEKWDYIFPCITPQKYNEYLKELGEKVGMNQSVSVKKYMGKKTEEKFYKKYELLSSHAARRTFIIISLMQGMKPEVVQKIVGHKDMRTMMGYVTILDSWKSDDMFNAWEGLGE